MNSYATEQALKPEDLDSCGKKIEESRQQNSPQSIADQHASPSRTNLASKCLTTIQNSLRVLIGRNNEDTDTDNAAKRQS